MVGYPWIMIALSPNDYASPVLSRCFLAQKEAHFREEAPVKPTIALHLSFDEVDGAIAPFCLRNEDAVDAEGGLFDFDRIEFVGLGCFRGLID
jgi:hypothetical protein